MWRRLSALLLATAAIGCSAPAPPPDLARAQRFEHDGEDERALEAYGRATVACEETRDRALRDAWCAAARLGRAETLERLGRLEEAAAAYEAVLARIPAGDPPARALGAAAAIHLRLGHDEKAYQLYWKAITDFPDQPGADEALRNIFRDGRKRNARQLYDALASLEGPLAGTAIADNLIFARAELARDDLDDPATALKLFDAYVAEYPDGPLADDALWEGAQIGDAGGDPDGELKRLYKLLATKEEAYLVGSYHSVYLDDARLRVGVIQLERGQARKAAVSFERLIVEYPDSTLRDDASFLAGQAWVAAGEHTRACKMFAYLYEKFPESRYAVDGEDDPRRRHGCEP